VIPSPPKPTLRRPSLLLPTAFSAQLRQPAHPIHPVKQLRDDRGHRREAAPPCPAPLVDGQGRLALVPRRPLRGLVVLYTQSASPGSAWCRVEGNPCSGSDENAQTLLTDDSGGERCSPYWRWDRKRVAPASFSVIGRTRTPPRPSLRRAATHAGGSMHSRSNLPRCLDLQILMTPSSHRLRPMTPRRKLSRQCLSGPTTG
jgi:hypothetical protein